MSMIFQFRMLSDEADDFLRDYEVPYDMSLLDFHQYIQSEVGYSPSEMASFFISDVEWEKFREFTLLDMGIDTSGYDPDEDQDELAPPVPMEKVTLGEIIHQKFDRLIYVFDVFAERQFYLELLRTKAAEAGGIYPRTVAWEGNPPVQFLDE